MTENKRFTSQRTDDYNYSDILDNGEWIGICHVDCEDDFVDKFNELNDAKEELEKENEELEREVSGWKGIVCSQINENSILSNEIGILISQGAEPSNAFKEYSKRGLKNEY